MGTQQGMVYLWIQQGRSSQMLRGMHQQTGTTLQERCHCHRQQMSLPMCWGTLNETSCKKCLERASSSILQCLPWSEGRALQTGCFMRYSNTNFLNADSTNGVDQQEIPKASPSKGIVQISK